MGGDKVKLIAVVIGGWIFSLCLHEFAHAIVAYVGGDKSVKDKGYLTFNPLAYAHPVYSLVLPVIFVLLGGLALPGGAVYIDTGRLRSRHWDCAVSLAGPLSNVLLFLVLIVPFQLRLVSFDPGEAGLFWIGYSYVAYLQIVAVMFNFLPLPPFDGFQAIGAYLKPSTRQWFLGNSNLFLLALIVVMLRLPAVTGPFWDTTRWFAHLAGIPRELVGAARHGMSFW